MIKDDEITAVSYLHCGAKMMGYDNNKCDEYAKTIINSLERKDKLEKFVDIVKKYNLIDGCKLCSCLGIVDDDFNFILGILREK